MFFNRNKNSSEDTTRSSYTKAAQLYGSGMYQDALDLLLKFPLDNLPNYYRLVGNCYKCLGDQFSALEAYDKEVNLYRGSDHNNFMIALKNRFELERGIMEYYDLTCRYNFELSGEVLTAIWDLERLKVGSVRKWDYYNQTSFRDVYESVEDVVKSFYNGESKALNKNSCKGAERWLEEWRRLCENR